jgi:stearoyl-CoA desaturase (Delta-9 desaturase)
MKKKFFTRTGRSAIFRSMIQWVDSEAGIDDIDSDSPERRVDWTRIFPFIVLHLGCLGVFRTGASTAAVTTAVVLYAVRMFAVTGFYHRYFSHKTFKTDRGWQFAFAVLGNASVQRGPLWWAAHHRHHHRFADRPEDPHSPVRHGFLWSHIGWLTSRANFPTRKKYVPEWLKFPELVRLNRFDTVVPLLLAAGLFGFGELLEAVAPGLGTDGPQMLVWGFFISTTALFHATATINSLDHIWGTRRFDTPDTSRNNALLALLTFGEGWHNNHHHYAVSARQGFRWWELDLTYLGLRLLERLGIVRELRDVPERILNPGQANSEKPRAEAPPVVSGDRKAGPAEPERSTGEEI